MILYGFIVIVNLYIFFNLVIINRYLPEYKMWPLYKEVSAWFQKKWAKVWRKKMARLSRSSNKQSKNQKIKTLQKFQDTADIKSP